MPSDIKTESTLFDRRTEFWRNYRIGRPAIPSSFYQRFYDYHATHGGSFGTVHDVGAGFGELSLELSKRFDHVIVSDPAPKSLDVARELIGAASSSFNKFSFRQERVEDCELPKASVDAIFCCNAIHWTDLDKAMAISTDQLKPHGTLFICLNGIPKYDSAVQPSWWSMVDNCLADVKKRMPKADVERILAIQDNGYDCIALPESDFEPGAVRLKLNMMGDPAAFVQAPESSKGGPHVSNVGPHDRLEEGVEEDWFFDVDIEGLRATVGSYPFDPDPDMLERHLSKLDIILAGGTCRGHWPVSILMATRRT
ncbi:MAG: hypothetical protein Q9157_006710 [Trypethelium eluteriae]